jgi:hypothetical protein
MRNLINIIEAALAPKADLPTSPKMIAPMLQKGKFGVVTIKGNSVVVHVEIPPGEKVKEYRVAVLQKIAAQLTKIGIPAEYSPIQAGGSTIGHTFIQDSPTIILVKDAKNQGVNRAGVKNEHELVRLIKEQINTYGSANVTFQDANGRTLTIEGVTNVDATGTDVKDRKKADVLLKNNLKNVPVSIKQVNAEMWESADTLFGKRARVILDKLVADGIVELLPGEGRKTRTGIVPTYKLSKEIVVEPTEQDAQAAVFGSDINPEGGIIIQDFLPNHFVQKDNNITIECYAVIKNKDDIPESHLMYFLIKNFPGRAALGYYGIGTQAVTMTRAFGPKLTKSPVFVNQNGDPIPPPVKKTPNLQIVPGTREPEPRTAVPKASRARRT